MSPCHGAVYDLDGGVVHGPSTHPLSHLAWHQVGPKTIAVRSLPSLAS